MTTKNIWDGDKRSQFRRLRRREEDEEEQIVKTNMTPAEEYKEYAKTVFARSYIASFADVAETPSNIKKVLKLGIFFFSVFGLFYQTTDFTDFYMGYPTLKNEFLLRPYYMKQPAITICNANRYRRSEYCKMRWMESTNYHNETEFCDKYGKLCPDYWRPYMAICSPKEGHGPIPIESKDVWDITRELSHTQSMIVSCTEKSDYRIQRCEKPYTVVPTISNLNQQYGATYCYTINSLVGNPKGENRRVGRPETISLELLTQLEEYSDPDERPSIYVSVHDRRRHVNPFFGGKRLYGGNKYTGYVMEMTEKKLMPPPYDTNCTDFVKAWEENGGHGPLTNQECVEDCVITALKERDECIPFDYTISHTERLCKDPHKRAPYDVERGCSRKCKNPCFERLYKMDYEENGRIWCERKFFNISDWCRAWRLNLTISFQKFWYIKVNNDPRIQDIEFFSNVGGYLGMWIGISLVDAIDFMGCVYLVAYFPILRKKLKENQSKVQDISATQKPGEEGQRNDPFRTEMGLQTISDGRPKKVFFRDPTLN